MNRIFEILLTISILSFAGGANQYICAQTNSGNSVQTSVQAMADDPALIQGLVGICARTVGGKEIVSVNAGKMLIPASNMKLITTGAAMHGLGTDYRFTTSVAYDGTITDGTLHGNLWIVGGGDPTLGSKDSIASPLNNVFRQWGSVNSNYIRKVDIDKNIGWKVANPRGDIMITINLSKPEKDPKAILAAKNAPQTAYPKCMLCKECVGFSGNAARPARQTLRTIPIILNNEVWHFQFSPYVYFENHCIALSDEHRPMHIDADTFERMFDFVELFPDYFIGSNADLPIVGGSILSHDHYQGGSKVLPEMSAPSKKFFTHSSFENVKVSIVDWYNSVIRLEGKDRKEVKELAAHILKCWREYSDKNVDISAKTRNEPHNTVTPIARFNDENHYVIDMILRNNRTDKAHPFGIFHPTEDLHNIKKEGIGIIEALGLFILPGRLASEAHGIRDILTGKTPLDFKALSDESNPLSKHIGMIAQLANDFGTSLTEEEAATRVTDYINDACVRILDCTAVFKHDEKGEQAFDRFMTYCGF